MTIRDLRSLLMELQDKHGNVKVVISDDQGGHMPVDDAVVIQWGWDDEPALLLTTE